MAVKVSFEIGHTAKLKSKKTPEGFTHDWELYVRGVDKSDISHFVDKVVFNLHDSFPKPKRVCKEAPYILKESGYAGFILPIDIYFKNRDDPKRVTYQYDLDLQTTGPPVHRSVVKKHVFNNPSEEFKQKLLKGGGILLMMNYDEKSRDSMDERSQGSNKMKLSNDVIKKNKIRPEDSSKMQTFATVFGPPITKTSTKVSPDPKSKGSPSLTTSNKGNSKAIEKLSSVASSGSGKEKNDKNDKKEKHRRSSPHRDRDSSKDSRKISNEDKHERKEEKNKEKSHSKDRDHSKDRGLKRPASPKRLPPSPKRSSPSRGSSASNRAEDMSLSKQIKTEQDSKKASSNSNKKSKKDKKSHEKDKERERKERDRERKDKDDRSNSSNPSTITPTSSNLSHSSGGNLNKGNVDTKIEIAKKAESGQLKDVKEAKKIEGKIKENVNSEKKIVEKQEKDTEKKHKHKKKEKSKEKDKEKDLSSKEKKKEKTNKQIDIKKMSQPSPQLGDPILSNIGQQKLTAAAAASSSANNSANKLSDQDSSDSESENLAPPATTIATAAVAPAPASESKSNNNHSDTSNSSFPDLMVQKPTVTLFEGMKPDKKDHKSREKLKTEKNGKKRKRKSKDDQEQQQQQQHQIRKSVSPIVNTQPEAPPNKQIKKEDFKIDNKINSPAMISVAQTIITTTTTTTTMSQEASPRIGNMSPVFRTPSSASVPVALSAASNNSTDRNLINIDYMSELRELQHKIMTLQDNNELQQVVEMIAATGRFEVTSKTFDFDLCALDRTTVQRLQDFLATTVS